MTHKIVAKSNLLQHVCQKPYWLMPIRLLFSIIDLVIYVGSIQINIPHGPSPFKDSGELNSCIENIIDILYTNGYSEWAEHLKSSGINATNPYHAANQTAYVTKHIMQQSFVKYLGIQPDLKQIYKHCHHISKAYTGNFDYLIDLIEPIAKILRQQGYIDLADNLSNGPYASQSPCECAGVTRDSAQEILKQKYARKLGIRKDLKKTVKFCQSVLRAYG